MIFFKRARKAGGGRPDKTRRDKILRLPVNGEKDEKSKEGGKIRCELNAFGMIHSRLD